MTTARTKPAALRPIDEFELRAVEGGANNHDPNPPTGPQPPLHPMPQLPLPKIPTRGPIY